MKKIFSIFKMVILILDKILSLLGKLVVGSFIMLFILYLSFKNWKIDKGCQDTTKLSFRGINFQFPMKVNNALRAPKSGFSRNYMWLKTDSLGGKNISAKWFFEFDNQWKKPNEINDNTKKRPVYGVAFELHGDSCKTDQEIVAEIQKLYPGNYRYFENYGYSSYIWERDCLTIFVKRANQYPLGYSVPEVSFCYLLDESQKEIFATYTGYKDNYPD